MVQRQLFTVDLPLRPWILQFETVFSRFVPRGLGNRGKIA